MLRLAMLGAVLLMGQAASHAQGCSQCRETVGQTPARTQQAYRRGILLLIAASSCVFLTTLVAIRRLR